MTALRASHRWRWLMVGLAAVFAAAAHPVAATATPVYQGDASAGWGYQEGDVLSANPGTWTSTSNIVYSYAWFNENSVRLGSGPTYTVSGSDVGHQIYAAITANDGTPPSLTVNTPTVGPMHYRPPVNTEMPTVSGPLIAGSTLTAMAGKWISGGASSAPIEISYSWNRGCSAGPKPDCSNAGYIGGGSSLVLSNVDLGRTIMLNVTASYPDGAGGQAINSVWLGNLGRVIGSSLKAGETLSGTVSWSVGAPGVQTVAFTVGAGSPFVVTADAAGTATFALDTTTLANGGTNLAVGVTWTDGTTVSVPIGAVTVSNIPPPAPRPVIVKPLVAKPIISPRQLVAGKRMVVTFAVTRSDSGMPLTSGTMICDASISGKAIRHAESFRNGKVQLTFIVPRAAKHKLVKIRVTIKFGNQTTTRLIGFLVH